MECIKITGETIKWFAPILTQEHVEMILREELYAIGAISEGTACGVLVFSLDEPLFMVEYIAVSDEYRRQGVGTTMLQFLCSFADETVSPVVCSFAANGKTDPMYLFFAEQDNFSVSEEEGYVCQVDISELKDIKLPDSQNTMPIVPFFELSKADRNIFWLNLKRDGEQYVQDLASGEDEDYVKPLCLCAKNNNGIQAAIFIEDAQEDGLYVSFVWCLPDAKKQLIALFSQLLKEVPKVRPEGKLSVAAVTPASVALTEKLLPGKEIIANFYLASWDMNEI
ncbi:MAG: GNAT family N-acetyltransferase [Oscillospiraceae bacterium]|nr:GNAT family N-acetyltransferase [Oscillospiraceae bacterium]